MANVKKGNLTRPPQWWKHLREWKRIFWKKERKAAQRAIRKDSWLCILLAAILFTTISAGPGIAAPAAPAVVAVHATADLNLLHPMPGVEVGSAYGGRQHPVTGEWRRHTGVDLSAHHGAPVAATGGGIVILKGWLGGYGRMIRIDHGNGIETGYAHLSNWAAGLLVGQSVTQGQIIGYIGSSGTATGPHLHYEVKVNGEFIDPEETFKSSSD